MKRAGSWQKEPAKGRTLIVADVKVSQIGKNMNSEKSFLPNAIEESLHSGIFGRGQILSREEHLVSRNKYEFSNEIKTYLWFISALAVQGVAISILVIALMIFLTW